MQSRLLNSVALQQQSLNPRARSALKRSFLVYAGLVLLVGWAYGTWFIESERDRVLDVARDQLSVASAVLATEIDAMVGDGVGSAHAALRHLREPGGAIDWEHAAARLEEDLTGPAYVRGLFLSDASRTVVVGRNGYRDDIAGQPFWLTEAKPLSNVRIGASFAHPADSTRQIIPIAFPVHHAAAHGAAATTTWVGFWLGLKELNERHKRLGIDESVIALVRTDGAIIAYTSNRTKPGLAPSASVSTSPIVERMRASSHPAVFEGTSSIDGAFKLYAVTPMPGALPMFISVSREMNSILAGWHRSLARVLWLAFCSSVVFLALTALIYRFIWEINRRETQFQKLFDSSLASILMIQNGRVAAFNDTASRVFRASGQHSLEGHRPDELSPPRQPDGTSSEEAIARQRQALTERGAIAFRWTFMRLDDKSPFEAEVHLSTIHVAEDVITLAIVHDISELERARRELQAANETLEQRVAQRTLELESANNQLAAANRELEQFSGLVSHDLRAPLGTISGQVGLLQLAVGSTLGAESNERLAKISGAVRQAADIVDGLLSLARITREDLRRERTCLSAIARDIVERLKDSDASRKVVYHIDPEMWVHADPRLMQSLLTNLLSNAWKYSGDKPETSIEVAHRVEGDQVIYRVSDNGVGFDMTYADNIFRAFERLPSGQRFKGIGLGLAIVSRIAERYGGKVWTHSQAGCGATFFFTLPSAQEQARNGQRA